jgi:hypothetical protein
MKRWPGTFVKKLVVQVQWVQQDLQIMGRSNCANLSDENANAVRTENKLRTIFVYNHYTKWLSNLSPGHCVEGKFNFVITWKEHVNHCMKYLSLQHFLLMNCFKPVCYVCIGKLVVTRKALQGHWSSPSNTSSSSSITILLLQVDSAFQSCRKCQVHIDWWHRVALQIRWSWTCHTLLQAMLAAH